MSPHRQRDHDVTIVVEIIYDVAVFVRVVFVIRIHHFPSPHRFSPPHGARSEHERRGRSYREMDPRERHLPAAGHGFELFAGGFRPEQGGPTLLSQVSFVEKIVWCKLKAVKILRFFVYYCFRYNPTKIDTP